MTKTALKIVGALLAAALLVVPTVFAAAPLSDAVTAAEETPNGTYTFTSDGAEMTVDKKTLNFSVKTGERTWYSGRRASQDDQLNNTWIDKLTDAVTVGYRDISNNNTTERTLSNLNTAVTFTEKSDGFDTKLNCKRIQIAFTLQLRLHDGKITVTIPSDSITESSDKMRLQYLLIYPFFDSSYQLVDGKIFVPDGSGAAIDLSKPTSAKQPYSARVYGADYGISFTDLSATSPQTASLPMFAFTYADGGSMVTADSGSEYCTVNAMVNGITTRYNLAYFTWIYREQYVKYYESTGTEGRSYVAFQEERNDFDLVQTMTLLKGSPSMSDVAKAYKENVEIKQNDKPTAAGLKLNFLMSDNKQGMFGKEVVVMSTADFVGKVADEISGYCGNLSVGLIGYTDGGLDGAYPNHFPLETKTGSKRQYRNLAEHLREKGVSLAFGTDFVRAQSAKESQLALNISTQFINVSDSRAGSNAKFSLMTLSAITSQMSKDIGKIAKYSTVIDFKFVGSMLYSGYNKNAAFNRTDAIETLVSAIESANVTANLYKPNAYMFRAANAYLDAPLSSSGYLIETESVPMLSMLLSGSVPMYSPAVNLNYTGRELVLRLIDYNIYPSFTLTEQDAIELYGTSSAGLFTSAYGIWKDEINKVYNDVASVLNGVAGASIDNRYSPVNGVYVTVYSNGISVIVNYTDSPVTVGSVTVPALSGVSVAINN